MISNCKQNLTKFCEILMKLKITFLFPLCRISSRFCNDAPERNALEAGNRTQMDEAGTVASFLERKSKF